jgi:hypothetical protein
MRASKTYLGGLRVTETHEQERTRKALLLADYIESQTPAELMRDLLDDDARIFRTSKKIDGRWWSAVAQQAKTRPPSEATRARVIEILLERQADTSDPFEGL